MTDKVITRFAPSPTGHLHIGGARTALFNWAFARHTGGKMLLRIEDTDRERSTADSVKKILDGLTWLGIVWDGEPISQFVRAARHREVAEDMLARGQAYHCYCSPAELAGMRAKALAERRPPRYDGRWRDRDPSEAPKGVAPVIRVKAPQTGEVSIRDHVQGVVTVRAENLDDLIILRSDGSPTYNLAVVVDDHDMAVTHIIRGDDHLTNAARQTVIYNAMGWTVPEMAHVPLIHGPDGAKFSKRHGALGVDAYRQMGYLPETLRNYLARLGWAHGDDEIFSTEQLVEWFSLEGLNRSPARFDYAKLGSLNGHYIRAARPDYLYATMLAAAEEVSRQADAEGLKARKATVLKAIPELQPRARTIIELIEGAGFIYATRPIASDAAAAGLLDTDGRRMLARLAGKLADLPDWRHEAIDAVARAFAEAEGVKLGKIAQPLRAALTGKTVSAGIFEIMELLGREEALARIDDVAAP
ncbi:MAG: glutamate--tRNA ligase [Cucumibacter sp.]